MLVANVSRYSTLTARLIPCKGDTSTTTGTGSTLTLSVTLDRGLFSALSTCPPIPPDGRSPV